MAGSSAYFRPGKNMQTRMFKRKLVSLARPAIPYALTFLLGFCICLYTLNNHFAERLKTVEREVEEQQLLRYQPIAQPAKVEDSLIEPIFDSDKGDGILENEKQDLARNKDNDSDVKHNMRKEEEEERDDTEDAPPNPKHDPDQPVVWMARNRLTTSDTRSDHRIRISTVFKRIGYRLADGPSDDWDVLYGGVSDLHRFSVQRLAGKVKPHQKINFMPGNKIVTSKDILMAMNLPNMPKTFKIPRDNDEYLQYRKEHPEKKWLRKIRNHRGKGVRAAKESDLNTTTPAIFQELISPLLIVKRKFDFAAYVMIESKDPLRVYVETGEWLLRYCPEDYYPFDAQNLDKYVIMSSSNINTWDMKVVQNYFEDYHMTAKESMLAYLRSQGHKTDHIERTVMEIIWNVYVTAEPLMLEEAKKFKGIGDNRNFFELTRFDFMMDENLNIFLVEVNAGPGMSSEQRPRRRQQLERTIYGYMALTGLASYTRKSMRKSVENAKEMRVWRRDLTVFNDACLKMECHNNCSQSELCGYCGACMSDYDEEILQQSYLEHMNRYDWQRVIPWPYKSQEDAQKWKPDTDEKYKRLSASNRWMAKWFWGKCLQNYEFCT